MYNLNSFIYRRNSPHQREQLLLIGANPMFSRLLTSADQFSNELSDGGPEVPQHQGPIQAELNLLKQEEEYQFLDDALNKKIPIDARLSEARTAPTPLMLAAQHNLPHIAQALLDLGADINFSCGFNCTLNKPLSIAIKNNHPKIIDIFLNHPGINLQLLGYEEEEINHHLLRKLDLFEIGQTNGTQRVTPFHLACRQLDLITAQKLLKKNALITAIPLVELLHLLINKFNKTDMEFELFQKQNEAEFQMIDFLILECIPVEHVNAILNHFHMYTLSRGHSFIEAIFSKYAQYCNQSIQTTMSNVFVPDLSHIVGNLLLALDSDEQKKKIRGAEEIFNKEASLIFDGGIGDADAREFIWDVLQKRINVNECYNWEKTALMIAAENGCLGIVTELLTQDPDVNARDNAGKSAFDMAVERGNIQIAQLLLQAGADKNIKCTADEDTPLVNLFKSLIFNTPHTLPNRPNALQMLHFLLEECIHWEHLNEVKEAFQFSQKPIVKKNGANIPCDPEAVHHIDDIISQYENRCLETYKAALPHLPPKDYLFFAPKKEKAHADEEKVAVAQP